MADTTVILVRQDGLGSVSPEEREFGQEMFDRFIHSLEGLEAKPQAICFYTRGVALVCEGSKAVFGLRMMEGMGVRLLVCKTCLEYYGLLDKVAVGQVVGMTEIAGALMRAGHTITL